MYLPTLVSVAGAEIIPVRLDVFVRRENKRRGTHFLTKHLGSASALETAIKVRPVI